MRVTLKVSLKDRSRLTNIAGYGACERSRTRRVAGGDEYAVCSNHSDAVERLPATLAETPNTIEYASIPLVTRIQRQLRRCLLYELDRVPCIQPQWRNDDAIGDSGGF